MGENDHIITAYRDHGHALAVGMGMNECMAELFGKFTGCSKGKGGSMHYFAPDKNFWGGHGIVGGQTPLGARDRLRAQIQGPRGLLHVLSGRRRGQPGRFPRVAQPRLALGSCPVIYIIENNGYSMGTSLNRSSKGLPLAKRANGFDMTWDTVNGHSIYDVRSKTAEAMRRAHDESRPTLLEMSTYRYRGHSMSDNEKYRDKDEVERYKQTSDPINLCSVTH
jgi:pyruvate dehydrogenase E1 component alpha subunit